MRMDTCRVGIVGGLVVAVAALAACGGVGAGVRTVVGEDYTLTMEVVDQSLTVGDQTPITLRLTRTDNSNLGRGLQGRIVLTVNASGRVDRPNVSFVVPDDTTDEVFETVVFTASRSGVAQVRASFRDITTLVKISVAPEQEEE